MLVSEAIQRIQSLYSRGVQSQDSRLMPRHIWNTLITVRAMLLVQKQDKGQAISQWDYSTIPCIELIPATPYECPCIPPQGCTILRSKYKLPQPLTGIKGDAIQSVTSLNGSLIINKTNFATSKYLSGNKYTSKDPFYLLFNEYLFVVHITQLKVVQVTELVNNPEDAWNFPSFCDEFPTSNCATDTTTTVDYCPDCCISPLDRIFPLDNETTQTALQMTANELINIFTQMRADNSNNRQDNTANSNLVHQPRTE